MSNNIGALRSFETTALNKNGAISLEDAKKLVGMAKTAEDKAAVRDMFAHDKFDLKSADRTRLLGQLGKGAAPKADVMVGKAVGNTSVVRTFGPTEGYTSKFQAAAMAKAQGAPPLAVVKDDKGMWHAVQTRAMLDKVDAGSAFPLKPDATKYAEALKISDVSERSKQLAMYGYGLPAELINVGKGNAFFDKEKLNVNIEETTTNGRAHVHDSDCACGKNGAALEISPGRLKQPDFMTATLMHEATHVADDDLLVSALKTYPGKLDRNDGRSVDDFKGWVKNQKGYTDAQKATLKGMAGHIDKQVEGSAYLAAFKTMIGTNKEAALDQLLGFVDYEKRAIGNDLKDGEKFVSPPDPDIKGMKWQIQDERRIDWKVRAEMMKQLRETYASLPDAQQQDFKVAVAIAEKNAPHGAKLWSELFPNEPMMKVTGKEIPTGDLKARTNDY